MPRRSKTPAVRKAKAPEIIPEDALAEFAARMRADLPEGPAKADRRAGAAAEVRLYRRIYAWFRGAILDSVLPGGSRLPPGRTLALQLGVSRNTVTNAFEQLMAEGFLEGRPGSGTFVAELPASAIRGGERPRKPETRKGASAGELSKRGATLANLRVTRSRNPGVGGVPDAQGVAPTFAPGVPGLDRFPCEEFARLSAKVYRDVQVAPESFGYTAPAGLRTLRETIAAHLSIDRGVRCEADQIVIVNGSQQGLDLCARLLLDPGDQAFVEDPGYLGARGAFAAAGAKIVGVPVHGKDGLDIRALSKVAGSRGKTKRRGLIYVTPSHQFPLGMTMSLTRRLELLEVARESGLTIIEDDYDSEYRYDGRPISAMQGLDESGRSVVYLGTFSKVLAPGLRLGYLVLPPQLVDAFVSARALVDRQPPVVAQETVARYMAGGGFHRHLRRMRELYRERRANLLLGLSDLPLVPFASDTGLHVTAAITDEYLKSRGRRRKAAPLDRELALRAAQAGLDLPALSNYYLNPDGANQLQGFLFGFAAFPLAVMRTGFRRLQSVFE
ncbi:MAG: PLP-dependent aminotransferase family protein [bacterium]|nr:PLP-dependent aminotransferase family protein [bacterium]